MPWHCAARTPHSVWSQVQISSSTRPLSLPPHPGALPAGSVQHLDEVVSLKHAAGMKLLHRYVMSASTDVGCDDIGLSATATSTGCVKPADRGARLRGDV